MTKSETVTEVVRLLVDYYHPELVYLIGSSARGDARPDSDLDFVVVLPPSVNMTGTSREVLFDGGIYQRLGSIPLAVDIVPFRRRTFDERSGWLMSLPAIALRVGKLEYASNNSVSVSRSA